MPRIYQTFGAPHAAVVRGCPAVNGVSSRVDGAETGALHEASYLRFAQQAVSPSSLRARL